TSMTSDTTVLGNNSNGYIGLASSVVMGANRSTFVGMNMSNALAVDISNFGGMRLENVAALKLSNCATATIANNTVDVDLQTLKTIGPGSGGAAASGSALLGLIYGASGAVALIAGVLDAIKTVEDREAAK